MLLQMAAVSWFVNIMTVTTKLAGLAEEVQQDEMLAGELCIDTTQAMM